MRAVHWVESILDRLETSWHALVDDYAVVYLTGPLPEWMHRALLAEAKRLDRAPGDIVYMVLRAHCRALVAKESEKISDGSANTADASK